jgi:chromosome segregation ATPase
MRNSEIPMTSPNPLDAALKRLAAALESLEAADERRAAAERVRADLEEELAVMQDDRARLAAELDGALAANRTLALANADVAARLDRAESMLRELIDSVDPTRLEEPAAPSGAEAR